MPAKSELDHSWYRYFLFLAADRQSVASRLLAGKYGRVLDLGCGNGSFLRANLDRFSKGEGLDISQQRILATSRLTKSPRLKFRVHDLNTLLPYRSRSIDLVVSLSTIEYLTDPYRFLTEIKRILKPGGELVIHTLNLAFFVRRLQLLFGRLPTFNSAPGWQGSIIHNFTWPTLEKLMTETGFIIINRRCSGLFPRLRRWWPNFLCSDIIIHAHRK